MEEKAKQDLVTKKAMKNIFNLFGVMLCFLIINSLSVGINLLTLLNIYFLYHIANKASKNDNEIEEIKNKYNLE